MNELFDGNANSWTALDRSLRVMGGAGSFGGELSSSEG